jgi:hypothetical protein
MYCLWKLPDARVRMAEQGSFDCALLRFASLRMTSVLEETVRK